MPEIRSMGVGAALVATIVAATVTVAAHVGTMTSVALAVSDFGWILTFMSFSVVGAVVLRARPRHPVAWLFLATGTLGAVADATAAAAVASIGSSAAPAAIAGWVTTWLWSLPIGLIVWSFTLFPTGRPTGPLSGWIGRSAFGLAVIVALVNMVSLWPARSPELATITELPDTVAGNVANVLIPVILACAVAAMGSLVVRFRRAEGVERQQLKWGAAGAMVMAPALLIGELVQPTGVAGAVLETVSLPLWLVIAAGIAITRHRLYDIDRIISRTMSYAAVTAVLAGTYVGTIVLATSVVPAGGDDLTVAGSTLLVAALFRPVRSRIQSVVDRRFNRSRYDAERAVRAFVDHVRDEVDLPTLASDVSRAVTDALQPSRVAVWLATPHQAGVPPSDGPGELVARSGAGA